MSGPTGMSGYVPKLGLPGLPSSTTVSGKETAKSQESQKPTKPNEVGHTISKELPPANASTTTQKSILSSNEIFQRLASGKFSTEAKPLPTPMTSNRQSTIQPENKSRQPKPLPQTPSRQEKQPELWLGEDRRSTKTDAKPAQTQSNTAGTVPSEARKLGREAVKYDSEALQKSFDRQIAKEQRLQGNTDHATLERAINGNLPKANDAPQHSITKEAVPDNAGKVFANKIPIRPQLPRSTVVLKQEVEKFEESLVEKPTISNTESSSKHIVNGKFIGEIQLTEKSYSDGLEKLKGALQEMMGKDQPKSMRKFAEQLDAQITPIIENSKKFQSSLEGTAFKETDTHNQSFNDKKIDQVLDAYKNHQAEYFSSHVDFVTNYNGNNNELTRLLKKYPAEMKKIQDNPNLQGLQLQALLIMPVQRAPRHNMLINAMKTRDDSLNAKLVSQLRSITNLTKLLNLGIK